MKATLNLIMMASLVATPLLTAEETAVVEATDCYGVSMTLAKALKDSPDNVLALVERELSASPDCGCEIVKAAIITSKAEPDLVVQIVATAVEVAPEQLRILSNCAVAAAPNAVPEVHQFLAELDQQGGGGYDVSGGKGGYAKGGYAKGGYAKGGGEKGGISDPVVIPSPSHR